MQQVNAPKLALSNIEFICLKMHAHPRMPARWYLRELRRYRFGTLDSGTWAPWWDRDAARGAATYAAWVGAWDAAWDAARALLRGLSDDEVERVARRAAAKIGITL